jgi:hypothetical protein
MTGYQSKKAAAQDKLTVDRTQVEHWLQSLKDIDALHHPAEPESADAQKAIADMGQALAQPVQEPIREAFEKWAKALPNYMDTTRFEAGYSDCNTDSAWAAWQAAQPDDPTGQAPCVRHCEATAFQIVIKNLRNEIERMKAADRKTYQAGHNAGVAHHKQATEREWVELTEQEAFDCFDPNPVIHSKNVAAKLKEKNA